jgi:hypothetical protein
MREAYFVAREQDVIVSQEALAEDIRECVVFFVEVKDAGVGCACLVDQPQPIKGNIITSTHECQASSRPSFHRPAGGKTRSYRQVSGCKCGRCEDVMCDTDEADIERKSVDVEQERQGM